MANVHQLRIRQAFASLFLFLAITASLWAAPANYLLDVKTSDSDLPDSSVTAIAQTPDGYLWIGTYNGLARFDGVRFVTFDPVTTPALKSARISALFVDSWGTLWINTYDGSMTSLRNGVFTNEWQGGLVLSVFSTTNQLFFTLSGHRSVIVCRDESAARHGPWKEIPLAGAATGNSFKKDGNDQIWYTVKRTIYRLLGTNSEEMTQSAGWKGKTVNSMSTDNEGHLWIGTDEGIFRWNGTHFEDQTPTDPSPTVNVFALYCTGEGCWVFGDGKVRKCVNREWVAEIDAKAWQELVGTFQLELNGYEDQNGGLWFTHLGSGLFHITDDGRTEHFSTENGLPSNLATCWFRDREGNVWVGLTRGGLVHLRKREFQTVGPGQGLGAVAVSSICEDSESNMWIGTFSGGLYRWQNGKLDRFDLPSGAYKECFFSVYPDSQKGLWLSAGREDLFRFENDQIVPGTAVVHGIKTILQDKQQRIWFGKPGGVSCLMDGALRNFPLTNGLNNIRALAEDAAGNIWIGTGDGNLFRYTNGVFNRYAVSEGQISRAIWSLLPQNDGTLWIGTFRGGLLRFDGRKFTRYTTQEGLPSDIIPQILDDRRGNFWIGSQKGIFSISKNAFKDLDAGKIKQLPCVSYGLSDGLPTLECSGNYQPACWRDHDGRLWFATAKGPVSVSPKELSINHIAPPVLIEEIAVNGKPQSFSSGASLFEIPPGERQLDIRYTALSFMAPDKVAFRYKLEGFDEDWVEAGNKRTVRYGTLAPDKYRFRVMACNNDGVWNEAGAALTIVIDPHYWQTWWFQTLVIVVLVCSIFATVRFVVTRKLQRKLERLQQQQALQRERERIAKDIHDDLGAGLTSILLQSALAQKNRPGEKNHLERISATATELVGAMDEIVWAIDPENDTLDAVVTYTGKYVQEFVTQAGVRCRLDLPTQLPAFALSSQDRHNLYLAIKEVLNNAVKHAGASEISLSFKLQSERFSFIIKDNGRGFVPGALPPSPPADGRISSGHGLRNISERLERIGGAAVFRSEVGKGTEVELTVPLQRMNLPVHDHPEN